MPYSSGFVTFVIPVGPYHAHLLPRALASVDAQTVPSSSVVIHDTARKGAGYARNRGIERVTTEFCVFLDADDEVLPEFVEQTLAAWQPKHFVYTDWLDTDTPVSAPNCPWMPGTRNVITTLLRTNDVRSIGGNKGPFDETLDGLEDTDLYLRLLKIGLCGTKVPVPLFRYGAEGQRSKAIFGTPMYAAAMQRFSNIYRELSMAENCGGCGASPNNGPVGGPVYAFDPDGPIGSPEPGDVLAIALWGGNQRKYGPASGRLYPRAGNGKPMWVAKEDVERAPDWWEKVQVAPPPRPQMNSIPRFYDTTPPTPQKHEVTRLVLDTADEAVPEPPIAPEVLEGVQAIAEGFFRTNYALARPTKDTTPQEPPTREGKAKPNVGKVRQLAQAR